MNSLQQSAACISLAGGGSPNNPNRFDRGTNSKPCFADTLKVCDPQETPTKAFDMGSA